ncbi:MAG: tetratricopeptide repeat protein [Saprospiraceae bacterium]|nr:tetratricopeptide repeat protein [Saprospiraceae bacterium]
MTSEADLQLIEQYLNNELTDEQVRQFRERMTDDGEFAIRVELVREMPSALLTNTENFRTDLRRIMQEEAESSIDRKPPPVARQFNLWKRLLVAAAIVAFITVGVQFFLPDNTVDLYSLNFTIPAENITTRDRTELSIDLQQALQAYSGENYTLAIDLFLKYLSTQPEDLGGRFFLAISQMATGRFGDAIGNLRELATISGSYQKAANWYLALAYLRMGETDQAKITLNELVEPKNSYSDKAQEILDNMD